MFRYIGDGRTKPIRRGLYWWQLPLWDYTSHPAEIHPVARGLRWDAAGPDEEMLHARMRSELYREEQS